MRNVAHAFAFLCALGETLSSPALPALFPIFRLLGIAWASCSTGMNNVPRIRLTIEFVQRSRGGMCGWWRIGAQLHGMDGLQNRVRPCGPSAIYFR